MTDFLIASEHELDSLNNCSTGTNKNACLADSDLDLLMLCTLESILTSTEWEQVFDRDYINPVRDEFPDGTLIYQVSDKLLEALRKLQPECILDCAKQWAETDEWTLREDSTPESIATVIQSLVGLAKLTMAEGKILFIRTEL
ncbi:MAG: hypothetical protein K2X81_26660 [Candidatus Obscuribacterales bacterium]|nr:hypothetical protein [Candidatus Obscuribacterales bacterium]